MYIYIYLKTKKFSLGTKCTVSTVYIFRFAKAENNNDLLYLYSAFLGTQSALHSKGGTPSTTSVQHPPGWCDGSHIAPECLPHTSLLVERRQSDEAISVWGWIGGHDGQRPMGNLARMPGLHPYYFSKKFLMTTESQDLGLTSHPKDGAFSQFSVPSLYWGVRTYRDHMVSTPSWSHKHLFQHPAAT